MPTCHKCLLFEADPYRHRTRLVDDLFLECQQRRMAHWPAPAEERAQLAAEKCGLYMVEEIKTKRGEK